MKKEHSNNKKESFVYEPDAVDWQILQADQKKLTRVLAEINKITQTIYNNIGGFHTEAIYQKAFETELNNNVDKFNYLREYEFPVDYRGVSVGVERPDFILRPNEDYFKLKPNEISPIFVELKKGITLSDIDTYYDKEFGEKNSDGARKRVEQNRSRQQLWKYFKSASISKNKELNQIKYGMIINFSKRLDMHSDPFLYFSDNDYADIEFYFYDSERNKSYTNVIEPFMILLAKTEDYRDDFPEELGDIKIELD